MVSADSELVNKTIAGCCTIFLSITYVAFAAVSTTIFLTFKCATYGDDETWYLVVDKR